MCSISHWGIMTREILSISSFNCVPYRLLLFTLSVSFSFFFFFFFLSQTSAVSCTGHFTCFHADISPRLWAVYGWQGTSRTPTQHMLFFFFFLYTPHCSHYCNSEMWKKACGIMGLHLSTWYIGLCTQSAVLVHFKTYTHIKTLSAPQHDLYFLHDLVFWLWSPCSCTEQLCNWTILDHYVVS